MRQDHTVKPQSSCCVVLQTDAGLSLIRTRLQIETNLKPRFHLPALPLL